jgi:putative membrane protein
MHNFIAAFIGIIHVYVFFLESIAWGKPETNKAFGMKPDEAKTNAVMAFNQGFYNLFLAIQIVVGLIALQMGHVEGGRALIDYAIVSVFAAGLVLFFSAPRLKRAALIQCVPALLYWMLRTL